MAWKRGGNRPLFLVLAIVSVLGVAVLFWSARTSGTPSTVADGGNAGVRKAAVAAPIGAEGALRTRGSGMPADAPRDEHAGVTEALRVQGRVTNEYGESVAGADLVFAGAMNEGERAVGSSGEDGTFAIPWGPAQVGDLCARLGNSVRARSVRIDPDIPSSLSGVELLVRQHTGNVRFCVVSTSGVPVQDATLGLTVVSEAFRGTERRARPGSAEVRSSVVLRTGPDGIAEAEGLVAGMFTGTCEKPDSPATPFSFEVTAGQATDVRVVLPKGGTVHVLARTRDGTPATNIRVTLESPRGWARVLASDASGLAEFDNVEPGEALIVAESTALGCAREVCVVGEGERATVDLVLSESRLIRGVVFDVEGLPVAGATVGLDCGATGQDMVRETVTGTDGRFSFGGLLDLPRSLVVRTGPLRKLMWRGDGIFPGAREIEIRLDFALTASASITCRAFHPEGRPCADAIVWVESPRGNRGTHLGEADDGTGIATVAGILPGEYSVVVRSPKYGVLDAGSVDLTDGEARDLGEFTFASPGGLEISFNGVEPRVAGSARVFVGRLEGGGKVRGIALAGVREPMALPLSAGNYRVVIDGDRVLGTTFDVEVVSGKTERRTVSVRSVPRRWIRVEYGEGLVAPPTTRADAEDTDGRWLARGVLERTVEHENAVLGFLSLPEGRFNITVRTLGGAEVVARIEVTGKDDETTVFQGQAR